jgi:DNA-binding beta-propeller fold protein YncE
MVMATGAIAQSFHYGQGARFVLGQNRFDAQGSTPINFDTGEWPASRSILGAASGVAYADGKLFVAEGNRVGAQPSNHRVSIFPISSILPAPNASFPTEDPRRCRVCGGEPDVVIGQPDFVKRDFNLTQTGMRQPTYVHSDGQRVVVADTENNRVLIWNSIPTANGQPADLVLGQGDFTSAGTALIPTAQRMRAPQGVWIQGNRLFVADSLYHRVLIWNTFPTSNNEAPDVVLGQPDFSTTRPANILDDDIAVSATNMLNPVSVTSDGARLYVTDLGHNRVLIWNSIPTSNNQPADIVLGQPDLTSAESRFSNNSSRLCTADGKDENDNDLFPARCAATMSLPRFALSDGQRLYVADSGNDRVMIWNDIPLTNGRAADVILGQPDEFRNIVSDQNPIFGENVNEQLRSAVDIIRTPVSLAHDGFNLYVTDPFNRRVVVYSPGDLKVPRTSIRNAASLVVNAIGTIDFDGALKKDEEVTIRIGREARNSQGRLEVVDEKTYKFKAPDVDKFAELVVGLAGEINKDAGDPLVLATPNAGSRALILSARLGGADGDAITMAVDLASDSTVSATTSGARLSGGRDAAKIGVGSIVSVFGERMAEAAMPADMSGNTLPRKLGGVEVICDGHSVPLMYVSPGQINAQIPFEFIDSFSASCYVRTEYSDGRVESSVPIAVPVIAQNPGIFTEFGPEPRRAIAFHGSSRASALIFIDGPAATGDVLKLKVRDREYSYTVVAEDVVEIPDDDENTVDSEIRTIEEINATNRNIRAKFIAILNEDPDVFAVETPFFTRILLFARQEGAEVNNTIEISVDNTGATNVTLSQSRTKLGGANVAGALVTDENPLEAGELFVIYATGLGTILDEDDNALLKTGERYLGSASHELSEQLDSLAAARTANLISAVAKPGTFGLYEITLELNSSVPSNSLSQLTVFQSWYVSNIATIQTKALPEETPTETAATP